MCKVQARRHATTEDGFPSPLDAHDPQNSVIQESEPAAAKRIADLVRGYESELARDPSGPYSVRA
jgi:hypothetical protein